MPMIQFTRLDGASESVDLDHCIRHLVAPRPRHKYDRILDPSRTWLFARTPDGRWVQCNPIGDWHEEVPKSEVYEVMLEAGYWPIPAELLPEAPQVPLSDPAREAANPPVPSMNGSSGTPPDELTATVLDLLDAAILLEAFDLDSCQHWPQIVDRAGLSGPADRNVREAHGRIMADGMMKSKSGRKGRHWITDKGRQHSRTHKWSNMPES